MHGQTHPTPCPALLNYQRCRLWKRNLRNACIISSRRDTNILAGHESRRQVRQNHSWQRLAGCANESASETGFRPLSPSTLSRCRSTRRWPLNRPLPAALSFAAASPTWAGSRVAKTTKPKWWLEREPGDTDTIRATPGAAAGSRRGASSARSWAGAAALEATSAEDSGGGGVAQRSSETSEKQRRASEVPHLRPQVLWIDADARASRLTTALYMAETSLP